MTQTPSHLSLQPRPLTQASFVAFGDVIETTGNDSFFINNGNCSRYHDLATLSIDATGTAGISLFEAKHYAFPITLELLERHPLGSQAFIPMSTDPFLVIVAPDSDGQPGVPEVFISNGRQGVNYFRNTWHGVLTPIYKPALFSVVDYIGDENNLEEHNLDTPYTISEPNSSNMT